MIRNQNSTSTSTHVLSAMSRWVVTGSPVQNSLADLGGLVRFLRFTPFDHLRTFDDQLIQPLRKGDTHEGVRRLSAFCKAIMIRRSKSAIKLPPCNNKSIPVEFSREEKFQYEDLNASMSRLFDLKSRTSSNDSPLAVSSTIQVIHKLRTFCNLGLAGSYTRSSSHLGVNSSDSMNDRSQEARETMAAYQVASGMASCGKCLQLIQAPEADSPKFEFDKTASVYFSDCSRFYCNGCESMEIQEQPVACTCTLGTTCTNVPVPMSTVKQAQSTSISHAVGDSFSTKIMALVEEIGKRPSEKQ